MTKWWRSFNLYYFLNFISFWLFYEETIEYKETKALQNIHYYIGKTSLHIICKTIFDFFSVKVFKNSPLIFTYAHYSEKVTKMLCHCIHYNNHSPSSYDQHQQYPTLYATLIITTHPHMTNIISIQPFMQLPNWSTKTLPDDKALGEAWHNNSPLMSIVFPIISIKIY